MARPTLPSVETTVDRLRKLLKKARKVKTATTIEPALPVSEFSGDQGLPLATKDKNTQYAIIEVAARQLFHEFVSSYSVTKADFIDVWNLLDILNICGDQEQCDPSLVWYLIEELLDSQKIEGCRRVFDYLESRRERLVTKFFKKRREMVILRCCNELLRRLSRAEDAVFCGRVFIFLFQSFPLGDKSSVNTKGDFNVENVTTFDEAPIEPQTVETLPDAPTAPAPEVTDSITASAATATPTIVESQPTNDSSPATLDANILYPIFWKLQEVFSNPPLTFDTARFSEFKNGLDVTLAKFKAVPTVIQTTVTEQSRKRKAGDMENEETLSSNFNPKYLTSRELFNLELSDLAFQRHILVQALILIDFMLSLTEGAKQKVAHITTQKALQYDLTLSEQDVRKSFYRFYSQEAMALTILQAEWAETTRSSIAQYLQSGTDGAFYHRMVNTVLSRDKNWVRWKLENCPEIAREPVSPGDYLEAMEAAKAVSEPRKMRSNPMGSLSMRFLSDANNISSLERLKVPNRVNLPSLQSMVNNIENVDLDIEMATEEEKTELEETRNRLWWKTLRLAGKTNLSALEKASEQNVKGLLDPMETLNRADDEFEGGENGSGEE